jgi:type II secretory pathway pseudopilin PulG
MGLVELLVALAISAALLTSVAVALDASFKAYAVNQQQAQLMQRARLAMNRIVTQIRSTESHAPYTDTLYESFRTGHVVTDLGIQMMLDDTNGIAFYQAGTQLIRRPFKLVAGAQQWGDAHVLLEGVNAGGFTISFQPLEGSRDPKLKRATITLTVGQSDNTTLNAEDTHADAVTLSTSIMPRKNLW